MLLAGGVDTHNSAGILHCCPASSYDCGGPVGCSVFPPATAAEPCSEKLRLQLASVGERFAGFKSAIAEDSRRRRLLEEERYRQIHQAVQAIESGVAAETKRRGDASKVLERAAGKMATEMLERLQMRIGKHIGHLTRQSAELMARCKATRAAFEAEVHSRTEREEAASEKLEELVKNLDLKIESEIAARHQQITAIKKDVSILLRGNQPREQFHTFVKEELEELRTGLAAATRARQEADDEILQVHLGKSTQENRLKSPLSVCFRWIWMLPLMRV
ncbi:hypothetical protein, conserved [Eimeria necatrix]|uniref:SF-assemblin n=1 Tax=Eimeria necatrix TaxID=51315 RepID=U6MIV2_9EIME|nr:hypothetical protein, conserved [Eimeria necatrix]CDJ63008.1 hypothetical protein, conserved [Eimeria necatrix]